MYTVDFIRRAPMGGSKGRKSTGVTIWQDTYSNVFMQPLNERGQNAKQMVAFPKEHIDEVIKTLKQLKETK